MNIMNSKVYLALQLFANFFLLNLLWLLMCLPVVTVFPATASMFGVVREWHLYKDSSFFRPFFLNFKSNFKVSFLIGILWLILASLLFLNYKFSSGFDSIPIILLPFLLMIVILFAFTTVFLFPVMVNYNEDWRGLLKNAMFISIIHFPTTLLALVILVLTGVIVFALPISGIIIFSASAYAIFALCHRVFRKIEQKGK
jgi:uncharacterized membrane protein YesL